MFYLFLILHVCLIFLINISFIFLLVIIIMIYADSYFDWKDKMRIKIYTKYYNEYFTWNI